jgi:hypothetical protein
LPYRSRQIVLARLLTKRQTKKIPGSAEDFFIGNSDD